MIIGHLCNLLKLMEKRHFFQLHFETQGRLTKPRFPSAVGHHDWPVHPQVEVVYLFWDLLALYHLASLSDSMLAAWTQQKFVSSGEGSCRRGLGGLFIEELTLVSNLDLSALKPWNHGETTDRRTEYSHASSLCSDTSERTLILILCYSFFSLPE